MNNIDIKTLKAFEAESREIAVRCTFNDRYVVDGEYIKDFDITDVMSGDETLSLGNTCSKQLRLDMFIPDEFVGLANAKIKVEIGIIVDDDIEYVPMGVYYVDSYNSNDEFKSVSIVAYDGMCKIGTRSDKYKYNGSRSTNVTTPIGIIRDIATTVGVETDITMRKDITDVYSSVGVAMAGKTSVISSKPAIVNKWCDSIWVDLYFDNESEDTRVGNAVVKFYNDEALTSLYATKTYSDYSGFCPTFDFDDPDFMWWSMSVELPYFSPREDKTIYMVVSFETDAYTNVPKCRFDVKVRQSKVMYPDTGVEIDVRENRGYPYSYREMLGYMASLLGGNAVFDANGKLAVKTLENTGYEITGDTQFMGGLTKEGNVELTPTYLTTGYQTDDEENSNIITVGTGKFGFNFTNPFIENSNEAQAILNYYSGLKFITGRVDYRCNPALQSGDIVVVEDKVGRKVNYLIKSQTIKVGGGLRASFTCTFDENATSTFISAPSNRTLTQNSSSFDKMYQTIVSKLTGNNGGYVKFVYDSENKMRAIAIPRSDINVTWDEVNNKCVADDFREPMWVWNEGGLYYTPDGGITYNVAMNSDGQIYANYLQAPEGNIAGWIIDEDSMYADYENFRAYIQKPSSRSLWAFSTQEKHDDGLYYGTFYVTASGNLFVGNGARIDGGLEVNGTLQIDRYITDMSGYQVFGTNNDFVFGYGAYANSLPTYLEGNTVYLRSNNNLQFQKGSTTRLTFGRGSFTMDGSTADRDFINSSGGLVIEANGGTNKVHIWGSSIYLASATKVNGNLNCLDISCNKVSASGTVTINYTASGACPVYMTKSGGLYPYTSSKRYKKNIKYELDTDLAPELLYELPVAQYEYKEEYDDRSLTDGKQIGLIAEDVAKYYPNAVIKNSKGEIESWQSMILVPAMLKLIQDQKKEIDSLNERLSKIEELLNEKGI